MMNSQTTVDFNMAECSRRAEALFLERSGIDRDSEKGSRMRQAAFAVRRELADSIQLKGGFSFYDEFSLENRSLSIYCSDCKEPVNLICTAFEQLSADQIEGVYIYAVTAGDHSLENRPIMDQLYADMWGTAFTDAAREALTDTLEKQCLLEKKGFGISDSFGPGFYGMDSAEMRRLPLLVDFDSLGMRLTESGVLLPLKSCAGILFKVTSEYEPLHSACALCAGSRKSCGLCSVRYE